MNIFIFVIFKFCQGGLKLFFDGTGNFTVGEFSQFLDNNGFAIGLYEELKQFYHIFKAGRGKANDKNVKFINIIFRVIDYKPKISLEGGEVLTNIKGDIEFVDVSFKYPGKEELTLKNLNFKINHGECVGLVGKIQNFYKYFIESFICKGESGCGKSTLIQLLLRFFDCTSGKLLIDGKEMKKINLVSLRNVHLIFNTI